MAAWVSLLRAHSAVTRRLDADLVSQHGLTVNDYEVLVRLARAPDRRMRRVDLAAEVLLTPSGITRLLDGLQRSGYVRKAQCDADARVSYAVLTDEGLDKLRAAWRTHAAGINTIFAGLDDEELDVLGRALARLCAGDAEGECEPPDSQAA